MRRMFWVGWIAAVAVVGLAAGCNHAHTEPAIHGEVFPPDEDPRAVRNMVAAESAAGARADATLYGCHFDEAGLNSLGQWKLDMMLSTEDAGVFVVYLDVPPGARADRDRQAVSTYLTSRGLPLTAFSLSDGPNPGTLHSAGEAVAQINALESPTNQPQGVPAAAPPTNNVQPNH